MSVLVIAEKPSVCREISHVLGAHEQIQNDDGLSCFKGSGYYVTSALGHLYGIGQPSDYGYSEGKWDMNELPMIPETFKVLPITSTDKLYKTRLNQQRKLIKELMSKDDIAEIICATDAGREGELIFRYIYLHNKCKKPVKRLWISSLTEESIKQGFNNLKPGIDYDSMFEAGFARAKADWIIGMNLSRLYSILDKCHHRVGRVKTPVLNIIVKRDIEIKSFIKKPYFKVILDNGAECTVEFPEKEAAETLAKRCTGAKVVVTSAVITEESENRPYLHSLTSLQQEANDVFGMTAADTLKAAQSLYEKKIITYPRTDSKFISDDMHNTVNDIVSALKEAYEGNEAQTNRIDDVVNNGLNLDKRVINNQGITDHHAIIPTTHIKNSPVGNKYSEHEKNVLKLIINRFLSALDKPYRFKKAKYTFEAEDYTFKLTVNVPLELGWKKYNQKNNDDDKNKELNAERLPDYTENSSFNISNATVRDCEKKPAKHYTDSTLLSAMENIDNIIDNKELKSYVKGKGIGTPATRASIIDELVQNKYIERKGKNLVATAFGTEFILSVPESIKSVERTAEWEQILENISSGESKSEDFINDIKRFVILTIESQRQSERQPMQNTNVENYEKVSLGSCPRCGKNIFEGKDNFYCESGKDYCGFTLWKKDKNGFYLNTITAENMKDLLSGKPIKVKKKDKDGASYTKECILEDTGVYINLKPITQDKVCLGTCPRCGKNVIEGSVNFYCESGRNGCGFTIWKQNKVPPANITAKNVRELLSKGETVITVNKLDNTTFSKKHRIEDTGKYINFKSCDG